MNAILRWGGWAGRLAMRRWLQDVEVHGREHLAAGPLLVMMNHSCVLDPFLLTVHARRPIQFLVTEPFMRIGLPSRFAAWWGQVPKRKLESDARSFRLLKQWCQLGGLVGLFPEGQFPWDGHPLPLQPGLAQLIAYLEVPVVTIRLINGDRLWPPWARHARRTRVRMEIDPPRRFHPAEPVEALVARQLHVDPDACARWPAYGSRTAEGLVRFLRYCPDCGADGALVEQGNHLRCGSCQRQWTVTPDNRLSTEEGSITLAQARQQVQTHWSRHWRASGECRSRGPVNVIDVSRRESVHIATGTLRLDQRRMYVEAWELDVADVLAHTLDWGDLIVLRTRRQRLAIRMPHDSRAIWSFALDEAARPR